MKRATTTTLVRGQQRLDPLSLLIRQRLKPRRTHPRIMP
jgi:hypothetical protein